MARIPHHAVRAIGAVAGKMLRDIEGHHFARQMQAEVNRLRIQAEALDSANASRNPLETRAAHAKRIAGMSRKLDQEITAILSRTGQILRDGMQDIQRRIDEKVDLRPNAFASEIRATFRTLDAQAKADLINQLVAENRGPEMAAIVKAPSVLTGISDEQKAAYERSIVTKHAGDEVDEQARFGDVFEAVCTATRTAGNFAKSLTDPDEIARIEREEAAANSAGDAFTQSLQ